MFAVKKKKKRKKERKKYLICHSKHVVDQLSKHIIDILNLINHNNRY